MRSSPSAAVLVLNYNGLDHLRTCLPTLEQMDYAGAQLVVVDNGSQDGSVEYVRAHHPSVRVIALGRNRGFTGAYNAAIREVQAEWVALLNNDTRVHPAWLTELVAAAERNGAAAAAAAIVDWDGSRVDFVGGLPTFLGHSWQIDYGQPAGRDYPERQILFGCGGAVMFRRDVFLESGGFDESYFIYFEDVDIGWRLTLMGHPTVFAPRALTYHRLHGTTRTWAQAMRLRLYERNALATIFKNYGQDGLARVLPAAVALTLQRNLVQAGLDGEAFQFGRSLPRAWSVPPQIAGLLIALEDFARSLPRLREQRAFIQARRLVPDAEVLALMPEPLKLHDLGDRYRETAEALIRDFRIAELFGLPAPAHVSVERRDTSSEQQDTETTRRDFSPGTERRDFSPSPERRDFSPGDGDAAAAEAPALRTPAPGGSTAEPGVVSVIVLTASGARHLPDCLDSLRQQDWPAGRLDVIVVDNGSPMDPTAVVRRHYPDARVIRTGANLGFSAGNNAGAREARGEWLLFLNDDTRVDPACTTRLVDTATRRGAASVGAKILDWSGERIDFAGGLANFEGRGYPLGWDAEADSFPTREQPLLFGCGAAVLFQRNAFEASGGWDEPTFAYYEDVEFGWRLWLLGHEVWFAPEAIVYHRHHGTSGPESPARLRAFERNALRMIYALLEERTLQQALPAALLLSLDRIALGSPFSRATEGEPVPDTTTRLAARLRPAVVKIRLLHALSRRGAQRRMGIAANLRQVGIGGLAGAAVSAARDVLGGWETLPARDRFLIERASPATASSTQAESVPTTTVAALLGVQDFLDMLPELGDRRHWLQARRRRSDAEIVERFGGHWRSAVPSPHLDLHVGLRRELVETLSAVLGALPPALDLGGAAS